MRIDRFVRGLGARAMSLLAPAPAEVPHYYPQVTDCQIPTLWYLYSHFFGTREHGTFVEVGANDGVCVSNSWGLASRGWTGWMIEPIPMLADQCRANHAGNPHIRVFQEAIGTAGNSKLSLHMAGVLSTANSDTYSEYSKVDWASSYLTREIVTVPCSTLDHFFELNHVPVDLDLLVVDVEGYEGEVFSSFDLDRWSPKMLIVELADLHPDLHATASNDAALGQHIVNKGYRVAFKDSVNTMFVRDDIWVY